MREESRAIYTSELRILQTSTHCKKSYRNDLKNKLGPIILIHLRKNSDFEFRGH